MFDLCLRILCELLLLLLFVGELVLVVKVEFEIEFFELDVNNNVGGGGCCGFGFGGGGGVGIGVTITSLFKSVLISFNVLIGGLVEVLEVVYLSLWILLLLIAESDRIKSVFEPLVDFEIVVVSSGSFLLVVVVLISDNAVNVRLFSVSCCGWELVTIVGGLLIVASVVGAGCGLKAPFDIELMDIVSSFDDLLSRGGSFSIATGDETLIGVSFF